MDSKALTWTKTTDNDEDTLKDIEKLFERWSKLNSITYETEIITEGVEGMYKHLLVRKDV